MKRENITSNVPTHFIPQATFPTIDPTAYIHPQAAVIGAVILGRRVFVAPMASLRADEGMHINVGDDSNVQDGVVLHGLETFAEGREIEAHIKIVNNCKYSIYIGRRVSLAHQCQIHGPAVVEDDTFVGMQALVFKAEIGRGCVIEPGARVMGVSIPAGRYVPAGMVVNSANQAETLPDITDTYPMHALNETVVKVNMQLAEGYLKSER